MLRPETKTMEALKITPDTYEVYLSLSAEVHHDLQKINNSFVVREKNGGPGDWSWFTQRDFRKYFRFVGEPSVKEFTDVLALPEFLEE